MLSGNQPGWHDLFQFGTLSKALLFHFHRLPKSVNTASLYTPRNTAQLLYHLRGAFQAKVVAATDLRLYKPYMLLQLSMKSHPPTTYRMNRRNYPKHSDSSSLLHQCEVVTCLPRLSYSRPQMARSRSPVRLYQASCTGIYPESGSDHGFRSSTERTGNVPGPNLTFNLCFGVEPTCPKLSADI